jgi:hypothetical protein
MMDCVLILFGRPLKNPIRIDPELQGPEPSWDSSLRVRVTIKQKSPLNSNQLSFLDDVRHWFSSKSSNVST